MSTLVLAEKACSGCGETKPLDDFHRNKRARDGHAGECKVCLRARVNDADARLREEMGDEYYKEHKRQIVARHRERTGNARGKTYLAARNAAIKALIAAHPDQFEALFTRAKYEAGL